MSIDLSASNFQIILFYISYNKIQRAVSMQTLQKSPIRSISNQPMFKKKELKKKISQCLHICQCGREFLSFPAVYSHAKTKHNFKISSRIGDQGRKIVEKDLQVKVYYQINNSELLYEKSDSQSNENKKNNYSRVKQNTSKFNFINKIRKLETQDNKKNIYAVMVHFLNESSKQFTLDGINFTAETLDLLTTCINEHYMHFDNSKLEKDYCSENTCETVPYYFNFFLIWFLPSKEKGIIQSLEKVEALLKIFFHWLKTHQYTLLRDESLEEEKSLTLWKSFFIKTKEISSDEKDQTVTKKQLLVNSEQEIEFQ